MDYDTNLEQHLLSFIQDGLEAFSMQENCTTFYFHVKSFLQQRTRYGSAEDSSYICVRRGIGFCLIQ